MSWLQIYHKLPYPLKCAAASLRGGYLKWCRYSRLTDTLVRRALDAEHNKPIYWREYQKNKLASMLSRAASQAPFYKKYWSTRPGCDFSKIDDWPVLEKEDVRKNSESLIFEGISNKRIIKVKTGGTTGASLTISKTRNDFIFWYALFEARWRNWYGLTRNDSWAIIGGQLIVPFEKKTPPFWVWNAPMRQLYCSTYHLSPKFSLSYLQEIKRRKVKYIFAYSSALHFLALEVIRHKVNNFDLKVVITNAEPLFDHQRQTIEKAFGCPVKETYGMAEGVIGASECDSGFLHLWPEVGYLELLNEGKISKIVPGAEGELLCTNLYHEAMPLVRYRVGDRVRFHDDLYGCPCRRSLPRLAHVEGRVNDYIVGPDQRQIWYFNPEFYGLPVAEFQMTQKEAGCVILSIVPLPGFDQKTQEEIAVRLRKRLGEMKVKFDIVEKIPRLKNGKFKAVVNKLP